MKQDVERFPTIFSQEAEELKPRPPGINLTTLSFFHPPIHHTPPAPLPTRQIPHPRTHTHTHTHTHTAETLSRASHENTWGKGMAEGGKGVETDVLPGGRSDSQQHVVKEVTHV